MNGAGHQIVSHVRQDIQSLLRSPLAKLARCTYNSAGYPSTQVLIGAQASLPA